MIKRCSTMVVVTVVLAGTAFAQQGQTTSEEVTTSEGFAQGAFPLGSEYVAAPLYFDAKDSEVVKIATRDLQADIKSVSHIAPEIISHVGSSHRSVVIIGTLEKCGLLSELSEQKKVNFDDIRGEWESFVISVVENPLVASACKALPTKGEDKSLTYTVGAVGSTPAVVLLRAEKAPRSVMLDDQEINETEFSESQGLLWIRFQNEARPRTLSIQF